jgi:ubiquinone/menaquinone biosynthesis C-methylase UbiE
MQLAHPQSVRFFWSTYRNTTMGRYLAERERTFITQMLSRVSRPCRLLDVGCGSGDVSLILQEMGLDVVAVDINLLALTEFQRHANTIPLVLADAQRLPFANASLDCVVAIQCLQYFDHQQFLRGCHRVLRDGGLLIFQAINRRNYKRALKRLAGRSANLSPAYNMSSHELLRATADHGFAVQAISGYNWVPFDRLTDNALVGATALVERALRLGRYYHISPWILIAARKR